MSSRILREAGAAFRDKIQSEQSTFSRLELYQRRKSKRRTVKQAIGTWTAHHRIDACLQIIGLDLNTTASAAKAPRTRFLSIGMPSASR